MPAKSNCTVVNRFLEEGINLGKLHSVAQFAWEDVVEQVPFPGRGPGLEGLKNVLRGMRSAFLTCIFLSKSRLPKTTRS
jgi:hypothetical protein